MSRLSHRCGTGHRAGLTGCRPEDPFPALRCSRLTFGESDREGLARRALGLRRGGSLVQRGDRVRLRRRLLG